MNGTLDLTEEVYGHDWSHAHRQRPMDMTGVMLIDRAMGMIGVMLINRSMDMTAVMLIDQFDYQCLC